MEHFFALPDCNLKSDIAQEILSHLNITEVLPWRTLSRFWRSACTNYVGTIDLETIVLDEGWNISYDERKYSWYASTEKDLCGLFFVCLNLNKIKQSKLQVHVANVDHLNETAIAADYKKELSRQIFNGKIPILYMFLENGSKYDYFLNWFEPDYFILRSADPAFRVDWTKINSVKGMQISKGAENAIDMHFYENVHVPTIICKFMTTEKFYWPGIATIIKDWQANRREITEINFDCRNDHRGAAHVEVFDVFSGMQQLIGLIGGNVDVKRDETLTSVTASIEMKNETETKRLWIGLAKWDNKDIQLAIRSEKIKVME